MWRPTAAQHATRRWPMPAVASEAREILAEIAIAACDEADSTDAILACFDATEAAVNDALKTIVVI